MYPLIRGEERDNGLDLAKGAVKNLPDIRAPVAGGHSELVPFARLQPDGTEPGEQRQVSFLVTPVDDHDGFRVRSGDCVNFDGSAKQAIGDMMAGHMLPTGRTGDELGGDVVADVYESFLQLISG